MSERCEPDCVQAGTLFSSFTLHNYIKHSIYIPLLSWLVQGTLSMCVIKTKCTPLFMPYKEYHSKPMLVLCAKKS